MEQKKLTSVSLPESRHTEIKILAAKQGISMTELVKRAIDMYVERCTSSTGENNYDHKKI